MTITKAVKTSSTAFQDLFPGADTGHGGSPWQSAAVGNNSKRGQ